MNTTGYRIGELIKELGLTFEQFGKPLGVSKASVSKWVNDVTKDLKNEHLVSIEDHYRVNMRWLITGKGDKYIASHVSEPTPVYSARKSMLIETIQTLDDDELDSVQSAAFNAKQLHDLREKLAQIQQKAGNGD